MAARITELVVDCRDPEALAAWWAEVLDYRVMPSDDDELDHEVEIVGPDGYGPAILFLEVPEAKATKNRLHVDLNATDRDQAEELDRLLELGATRVDIGQGDRSWVVLADPEGNEFCLLRRRVRADGSLPIDNGTEG
jgi:hypothetical protein